MAQQPTEAQLQDLEDMILEYAEDPELFFTNVLKVEQIWDGMREIFSAIKQALVDRKPIAVGSGHALSKDFTSGGLPLWWELTRWPAKTILTGPTDRQVKEILWNELEQHYARGGGEKQLGGNLTTGKLEWDPQHFVLAFTTSKSSQHIGKAQGFHSPNILIIVTEAQAVSDSVFDQIDGLTTSGQAVLLVIGNPLHTTGRFAKMLNDPLRNHVIHLDCEQSPNVIAGREIIAGMVSKEWVDDKRDRWFKEDPNHPLWLSKVKGQLPKSSIYNVFSFDMANKARNCVPSIWSDRRCSMGVDPAAFGDDESAFYCTESGDAVELMTTAKQEPTDTAGRAAVMRARHKADVIVVDTDGLGEGVASMLRELAEEAIWTVIGVKGSQAPTNPKSDFQNRRAEMWFHAREQMVLGRVAIPDDQTLIEELTEVKYFHNKRGKVQLEDKKDVKERLGRSPDRADAWILGVWGLQFAEPRKDKTYPNQVVQVTHRPYEQDTRGYMTA